MQASDKPRFTLAIEMLASSFKRDPEPAMFEGYWWGLEDMGLEALESACKRAVRECKYMPLPVELRRLAGLLSPQARAVKAWDAVVAAIAAHGGYQSVQFDDPLTNAAVRTVGGWRYLCRQDDHELVFAAKGFERAYQMHHDSRPTLNECRHLPGTHELENLSNGRPPAPPVMVETGLPPESARLSSPVNLVPVKRLPDGGGTKRTWVDDDSV